MRTNERSAHRRTRNGGLCLALAAAVIAPLTLMSAQHGSDTMSFQDDSGMVKTVSMNGPIDMSNPFFQSLGSNGRACATCHQFSDAMSISAEHAKARFDATQGLDPLFRTVDGSNCDHGVDVSTLEGRRAAYGLLRTRAVLRIGITVPETRDFEIMSVINPYGCNERDVISTYRRPLPGANLRFLSALMWDGRESAPQGGTQAITSANYPQSLMADLAHQALDATMGHAQGSSTALTAAQQQAIVNFETSLVTAQAEDNAAGNLSAGQANGGPDLIAQQNFYLGINDPVGLDPLNTTPLKFDMNVFHLFGAWQHAGNSRRQAIARGEELFNTRTFTISNVAGLNGATFSNGVTGPQSIVSTCGLCHDTPNVGNHSVSAPLNIGVADPPGGDNVLDTRYLPVITICQKPNLMTCVQTTDPGRALISGNYADVGKFKGPILRGLAARAPYFHNGSARNLRDVVEFYDSRFHIGFSDREISDLVAFLSSL